MKKLNTVLLVVLVLALLSGSAFAQTVRFEGETPAIPITDADGEALEDLVEDTIVLLGLDDEGAVAIYANGAVAYATTSALKSFIPDLDSLGLPSLSELEEIKSGSDKDKIIALQQALIELGYLTGEADGSFGGQSRRAVSNFQKDMGIKETGAADAITQQLIFSVASTEKVIEIYADPAVKYAAIIDRTETDLSPLFGHVLSFEYDDITGSGYITNNGIVSTELTEGPDIDQFSMSLRFGFAVTEKNGVVTIKPAAQLTTTSVRAPLVKTILLKSGETRLTIKVGTTTSGVDGSRSVETNSFNINLAAAQLLAGVEEIGELKIRVEGKYQSFDFDADPEQFAAISEIGAIAVEMLTPPEEA